MKTSDDERKYDVYYKRIASNIKAQRILHRMTQANVAEKLDMDTQYYAVIERADTPNRNFTLDKVLSACIAFNCTPNEIMGTDFVEENHNREMLVEKIDKELDKMTDHQLNIILKYIENIIPMI
ncbi:MAG: helix-turn-helix domain-containing protein [Lachnospiraceae bacterium]|nr:helix-turn-helix domain-containing protein [Lachnospiraceae bacterium]